MSDHYPIGLCWKMKNSQKTANHKLISYRRTKSLNFEHLSESINCKLLNENLPSVDTQVRNFTSTLNSELVKHAPIIHKRVKLNKQPTWSNEDILQHIKKRNNYKNRGDFENYKIYRNQTKELIKKAKKNYYGEILQRSKENSKKVWNLVKEISEKNPLKRYLSTER